jgi:hypothetical protein
MKRICILFAALFSISGALKSQRIAVKVQVGYFYPGLTHLKGEIPNCSYSIQTNNCPDIGVEYIQPSGFVLSATIGYQRDWFNFWEKIPKPTYGGPVAFAKMYRSVPVIFSAGYAHGIGKSNFHFNALAGIGFGMAHSENVSRDYFFESAMMVTDEQGEHFDMQRVRIIVEDNSVKKLLPQARISAALEYQFKHLFIRAFAEARSWLGGFGEVKYHSENSSDYYQFSQVNDGHFSLRAGYLGAGIGLGWNF